jgi:hypothetical protein
MVCKILSPPFTESTKVPVMAGTIARVLVLRHDALDKCAIKAAATKDSAARASFVAERKQLLRLEEQAERGE